MRLTDAVLTFPYLVLALALAATFSPSLLTVVVAVVAHLVGPLRAGDPRAWCSAIRATPFVETAHALGAGHLRVIGRHVLPNVVPPIVVLSTLDLGLIILSIAALSYLGLGVQPPAPEWGMMLNESRLFMFTAPHLMIVPGATIFVTVLAANLLGDALRDVLDPRYVSGGPREEKRDETRAGSIRTSWTSDTSSRRWCGCCRCPPRCPWAPTRSWSPTIRSSCTTCRR